MSDETTVDIAGYVDQMTPLLELSLTPEMRDGVIDNMTRMAAIAQLVLDFPIADEIESGTTFQP